MEAATPDILHGRLAGSNANLPRRFSTLALGEAWGEGGGSKSSFALNAARLIAPSAGHSARGCKAIYGGGSGPCYPALPTNSFALEFQRGGRAKDRFIGGFRGREPRKRVLHDDDPVDDPGTRIPGAETGLRREQTSTPVHSRQLFSISGRPCSRIAISNDLCSTPLLRSPLDARRTGTETAFELHSAVRALPDSVSSSREIASCVD